MEEGRVVQNPPTTVPLPQYDTKVIIINIAYYYVYNSDVYFLQSDLSNIFLSWKTKNSVRYFLVANNVPTSRQKIVKIVKFGKVTPNSVNVDS